MNNKLVIAFALVAGLGRHRRIWLRGLGALS
jgi:hypothetical protein